MIKEIENILLGVLSSPSGSPILQGIDQTLNSKKRAFGVLTLEGGNDFNIGSSMEYERETQLSLDIYLNKLKQENLLNLIKAFMKIKAKEIIVGGEYVGNLYIENYSIEYSEETGSNIIVNFELVVKEERPEI